MESLFLNNNNSSMMSNAYSNGIANLLAGQISPTPTERPVNIELENGDLWRKFNHVGSNEMILTKSGRRMFPTLRFRVSGMDPNAQYAVMLEFVPVDSCRYRFINGEWSVAGRGDHTANEATSQLRIYSHPDGPAPGRVWMKSSISFHKVKLTNNLPNEPRGHVLLHSMHKYLPRVHVVRLHEFYPVPRLVACLSCPETAFVAVTAYQNEKIIGLKIDHNPFAKGFRESDKRAPRRESPTVATGDEPIVKRLRINTTSTASDDTFESSSASSSGSASVSPPIEVGIATPLDLSVKSVKLENNNIFSPTVNAIEAYRQAVDQMQFGFNPFFNPFATPNFGYPNNFLSPMGQVCPPTPPYRYQRPQYPQVVNDQAEFLRQRLMASALASMGSYNHC